MVLVMSRNDDMTGPFPIPIIFGIQRSGTSLLRAMLDSHPDLAVPYETHFWQRFLKIAGDTRGERASRQKFLNSITKVFTWDDFGLDREEFSRQLLTVEPFTLAAGVRVFYNSYAARFSKPRCGDKTPSYMNIFPDISLILPEARFIHLIRDGRDVAVSLRDLWFGPGNDIEKQAMHWKANILQARHFGEQTEKYMELPYENLVNDPKGSLEKVCEFIDLPYDEAMETYYVSVSSRMSEINDWKDGRRTTTREEIHSIHTELQSPPHTGRIGRWKEELSPKDRGIYENIAGNLLRELGYEL